MEIEILLFQDSGKEIRNIFCSHLQSETQQKDCLSFYRCLVQPVIYKSRQLRRCRIHGLRRIGFFERIQNDIFIYFLWNLRERFLQFRSFVYVTFQMITKRNQRHFFIQIVKDHVSIFILEAVQTYYLPESLCRLSGKFIVLYLIKCHCLFKIQILHTIFHAASPLIFVLKSFQPGFQSSS